MDTAADIHAVLVKGCAEGVLIALSAFFISTIQETHNFMKSLN
jgi:hypothetical protein